MKRNAILFMALFTVLAASPAMAQQDDLQGGLSDDADQQPPPISEYNDIGPGILLQNTDPSLPKSLQNAESAKKDDTADAPRTFRQIMEAYYKGDYDTAFKSLLPLARKDSGEAQEVLGLMYRMGQGVQKNPEYAVDWLLKAADHGRPLAQHHLSSMYFGGEGVNKDPVKALMWIKLALIYYKDGAEKERAEKDKHNMELHLSSRDRERANLLAKEWLEKRGEAHLLSLE